MILRDVLAYLRLSRLLLNLQPSLVDSALIAGSCTPLSRSCTCCLSCLFCSCSRCTSSMQLLLLAYQLLDARFHVCHVLLLLLTAGGGRISILLLASLLLGCDGIQLVQVGRGGQLTLHAATLDWRGGRSRRGGGVVDAELVGALRLVYLRRAEAGEGEEEREKDRLEKRTDEDREKEDGEAGREPMGDRTGRRQR